MARLHILHLPGEGYKFAFIVDQHHGAPHTLDSCIRQWRNFAQACGAVDVLVTDDTVKVIDPFISPDLETPDAPEPEKPWEMREVSIDEAPEAIQRLIGAAWGVGPFWELHDRCGPECDCAALRVATASDEPTADSPPEGDDGAPAAGGELHPGNPQAFAEVGRLLTEMGFKARDRSAEQPADAPCQDDGDLTGRERRLKAILDIPDDGPLPQPQVTITPLDASGKPTGGPVTFPSAAITITNGAPVLDIDTSIQPSREEPSRRCGAQNTAGSDCQLELGHAYLHEFATPRVL